MTTPLIDPELAKAAAEAKAVTAATTKAKGALVAAADATSAKKTPLALSEIAEAPFWDTYRLAVCGAPGAGKTRLLGTLSKHWKEDEKGQPLPAYLEDILICETDEGGLNALREWGVGGKYLEMGSMSDADIVRSFKDLPAFLASEATKVNARAVCIDTGSRLVKALLNVLIMRGLEKAPLYNQLAMDMRGFMFAMRAVKRPLIWNFHIKRPGIIEGKDDDGVRIASGLGAQELEMDVDGTATKQLIRDCCTHIYHLETKEMPGGKTSRVLNADSRVESKRRMQKFMLPQMPANLTHFFGELARSVDLPVL